jgi:two-component system osmolarity sensor histidine kinase EnvZ
MASGVAAGMADPGPDRRHFYDLSGRAVIATLQSAIASPVSTDLVSDPRLLHIRLATGKGLILAEVPRARVAASNPHQLLVLMVFAALVLTAISILFLRNQIAPILALASAAEAFGKGQSIPYQPRGAEEVRRAGRAFLSMRSRIERQIEARTLMLSGVSHDLRTPITRMKLSLSLAEDTPETAALAGDLAEMEHMLEEFLTFARGEREEEPERFDAAELIRALAADTARGGRPLDLALPGEPVPVTLRRMALMRALTNLTGNALRYGQRVRLTLDPGPGEISFRVEDDGPGIPEEQYEQAVKPFTQLDPARNRNRGGGVGLGLAIAQDVAFSHGGRLELGRSPLGGLSAALRLPR